MIKEIKRAIMTPFGLMPKPESVEDITVIEPFKPQPIDKLKVEPYSCFNCDYLLVSRVCGRYDSPLPQSQHGDEICWREYRQ